MNSIILKCILTVILLLPQVGWSQYAIELDKGNTFINHQSYLINIVIPKTNLLLIMDRESLIPVTTYLNCPPSRLGNADTIIVFQNRKHKPGEVKKKGMQMKTQTYLLTREKRSNSYTCDSLAKESAPIYKIPSIFNVGKKYPSDSVLIYYSEDDSRSACCGVHPDTNLFIEKYIDSFEKKHAVHIGKTLTHTYGDEGEHTNYFTLSGLTMQQKINFIYARTLLLNREDNIPNVYFPSLNYLYNKVFNKNLSFKPIMEDPNEIYGSVETQPYYVKGQPGFEHYIYQKMNLSSPPTSTIIISFTVNKDGSLTGAKVTRGGDDELAKKLTYVILHAPKWKPGTIGGKVVRCTYSVALYRPNNN